MAQEKPVVITVGEEEIDVNCSQASAEAGAEFNAAISIVEDEYH